MEVSEAEVEVVESEDFDLDALAYAIDIRRGQKTIEEVAAEIDGVGKSTINNLLRKKVDPSFRVYRRICRWLDQPLERFLRELP
jgi:transcriptional regulator with XRE-family HTH domain